MKRGKLAPSEKDEALRVLRAANFQVIGTTEEELVAMLASATVEGDSIVETPEMTALRENLLAVAASRGLQPREEPWLRAFRFAVFRAIRTVWAEAPGQRPGEGRMAALPPAQPCRLLPPAGRSRGVG